MKMLIILFVILILLLALLVYAKPLLERMTPFSVDISGVTYTGTLETKQQYEIDISGVTHTGYIDISNGSGGFGEAGIINNITVNGTSGSGSLNDTYLPGTAATSGGHYTSPLDFLHGFPASTGMYTDIGDDAGSLLPTSNDVSQTNYSLPSAEESQLGTLGVDYNKCMEGDHVPPTDGSEEPIGTYYYLTKSGSAFGNVLETCAEQVAPCGQFNEPTTGLGDETRCTSFSSRAGRQLCNFTAAVTSTVTADDGTTSTVVDASSNCVSKTLDPPYMVDAPAPSPDPSSV